MLLTTIESRMVVEESSSVYRANLIAITSLALVLNSVKKLVLAFLQFNVTSSALQANTLILHKHVSVSLTRSIKPFSITI